MACTALASPDAAHDDRSHLSNDLLRRAATAVDEQERQALLGEVVLANLRVSRAVARRFARRGVPLDDLEQAAYEGLVKAVQRFDPSQGHDLLTYAVPSIRGEVLHYFRDQTWVIRPPRRVQEARRRVAEAQEALSHELGRTPTLEEVRARADVDRRDAVDAARAFSCHTPVSLDEPVADGSATSRGDLVAADDASAALEATLELAPALDTLSARDRRMLHLRYVRELSQDQIARELGLSQVQVSRLLARITADLRTYLTQS